MKLDARVEHLANHICHMVNINESIHLSHKSRHDVFFTVRAVADYWKKDSDKLREENHAKRWNELTIWLRENPHATGEEVQKIMNRLNQKESVRGVKTSSLAQ